MPFRTFTYLATDDVKGDFYTFQIAYKLF